MNSALRGLLLAAMSAAIATTSACKPNDYCLNCGVDDGGVKIADAGIDAPADAFVEADGGICHPTNGGIEICDGKDNDCDGRVDEGSLDGVGVACGNNVGTCTTGTTSCTAGKIVCSGVAPVPEICDGLDNNCDGSADEGDPGGGGRCGIAEGNCVQGTEHCIGGSIQCIGAIAPATEICNGQDDDCDGNIDEDVPTNGSCGTNAVGLCKLGLQTCVGGGYVCVGAVNPTFEICDNLDNDCDGVIDNGFNTQTDPLNCGGCTLFNSGGMVTVNHRCTEANAVAGCTTGMCSIAACNTGFFDIDHSPTDGCEYACTLDGAEVCDGKDNDCNGVKDDGLTPPANLCLTLGECHGTVPVCSGSGGWTCPYPATVSTDGSGNIIPETTCDGLDNDCDGKIDENQAPQLGTACQDNKLGACQTTGTYVCNTGARTGPAICNNAHPGAAPTAEKCNGIDDDCDGFVDNGAATGNLPGQNWVTLIGTTGTTQIMAYEAARPDATSTANGSDQAFACSQANVMPWTNVTYPQAVAACTSIGARLCTEAEWQGACEQLPATPLTYPLAGPVGTTDYVFVEAENALLNTPLNGYTWATDATENYSGVSDLLSTPDSGNTFTSATVVTKSPRLDFKFTLAAGTYTVWVRMFGVANGDSIFVGLSAMTPPTAPTNQAMTPPTEGLWTWVPSKAYAVVAGTYFASVYMRKDGVAVDAIAISQDGVDPPPYNADVWAYASNPKLSQPTVCNVNSSTDVVLPTGSEANCYANGRYTLALKPPTTDIDTVLQSIGNTTAPSIIINSGAAAKAGTYAQAGNVATFTLDNGVSTVTDFEALVATSTLVSIRQHGTAANVFHSATDVLASTPMVANHAFDMSGNVKEWAQARASNQDPLRGGAADNDEEGATCDLNFSLATDTFFFPNVGFRCCR